MTSWIVRAWGEPESMTLEETTVPEPKSGEVRIRHHASGINFFDLLQVRGLYQIKPPFPFSPGAEVAGIEEASGRRVMALPVVGGFAQSSCVPRERVFDLPDEWSFAEGAGFLIVYHTGWYALHRRAALQPGETLLVHAGASGVGMAAIHLGKAMGARVIATAGSQEKREFAQSLGADAAIDYLDGGWPEEVKKLTGGRGADVIYDPVGGDAFDLSTKCIASEGRLLVIGFASGRIPTLAANRALIKNFSMIGAVWGGYAIPNPAYLAETQRALIPLLAQAGIRPVITSEYDFTGLPKALRDVDQRRIIGKSVILWPQ